MTDVGWVGLGAMGAPMARVLAEAGHAVKAFDVDPQRSASLSGAGVAPAASASGAAEGSDVLAVMVATAEQAESALFGPAGAAAAMRPGGVVLVMSTVGVAPVRRWSAQLGGRGVQMVDAPVSGGTARAAAGDLLMMVSGDAGAIEKARSLIGALSSNAPVVGTEPGEGQKWKLVNQLLCGVHIAAAAEALVFAEALGLDLAACWEVLRHGAAASFMFENRGPRMIGGDFTDVKSALDMFVKDMGLVVDAADGAKAATMLAHAAQQVFLTGAEQGYGRQDDSCVIKVYRALRYPDGGAG
jgi:3-hydroxyisobutyrate dehydrogenase